MFTSWRRCGTKTWRPTKRPAIKEIAIEYVFHPEIDSESTTDAPKKCSCYRTNLTFIQKEDDSWCKTCVGCFASKESQETKKLAISEKNGVPVCLVCLHLKPESSFLVDENGVIAKWSACDECTGKKGTRRHNSANSIKSSALSHKGIVRETVLEVHAIRHPAFGRNRSRKEASISHLGSTVIMIANARKKQAIHPIFFTTSRSTRTSWTRLVSVVCITTCSKQMCLGNLAQRGKHAWLPPKWTLAETRRQLWPWTSWRESWLESTASQFTPS